MHLGRSSRSAVALVTALLLLLCQTAFAAGACAPTSASDPVATSAAAPCHEGAVDPAAPRKPPTPSVCEESALPDVAKAPVVAPSDMPGVVVEYEPLVVRGRFARHQHPVDAVCHSPPLNVLHCRFLN